MVTTREWFNLPTEEQIRKMSTEERLKYFQRVLYSQTAFLSKPEKKLVNLFREIFEICELKK